MTFLCAPFLILSSGNRITARSLQDCVPFCMAQRQAACFNRCFNMLDLHATRYGTNSGWDLVQPCVHDLCNFIYVVLFSNLFQFFAEAQRCRRRIPQNLSTIQRRPSHQRDAAQERMIYGAVIKSLQRRRRDMNLICYQRGRQIAVQHVKLQRKAI